MPKGKAHPEFYIAFYIGLTPKDLIKMGFKKWSVYNYFRRYNRSIKPAFLEILKYKPPISEGVEKTNPVNGD